MEIGRQASSILTSLPSSWRSCDILLRRFAQCITQPASILHPVSPSSASVLAQSLSTPGSNSNFYAAQQTLSVSAHTPSLLTTRQAHTTSNPSPPTTATATERVRVERVPPSLQERRSRSPALAPPMPWTAPRKPSHQLTNNKEQPPSDTVYLQRAVRWGVSTPQQITGRMSAAVSIEELAACVTRHEHIMNLFSTTAAITRLARLREEHQSQHGQTRRPPRHTPFPSPFPTINASSSSSSSSVPVTDPTLTSSSSGDTAAATPSPDIRTELQQRFDDELMKLARRLVDLLRFNLGQDSAAVAGKASLQSSQLPLLSQCLWALSRLSELYPELKKLAAPIVHLLHKPAFFHSFEDHPPEVRLAS